MIPKDKVKERFSFYRENAKTLNQKYALWKALDFEKMIKKISANEHDEGFDNLKILYELLGPEELKNAHETLHV